MWRFHHMWTFPRNSKTSLLSTHQAPASTCYSNRTQIFLCYSNPTRKFLENDRVASSRYHLHCWIITAITSSLFVILPVEKPGIWSKKKKIFFSKAKPSKYSHWSETNAFCIREKVSKRSFFSDKVWNSDPTHQETFWTFKQITRFFLSKKN